MDLNISVLKVTVYGQVVMMTLIELGKKEIEKIGLTKGSAVVDGYVVRQPKAYPVYDQDYKEHVENIRQAIKAYPGLYSGGKKWHA